MPARISQRRIARDEEAVSPVIATILMVAVTVVLAATVYIWVSGFGASQPTALAASFSAKAVDIPTGLAGADGDTTPDGIEVVYVQGNDLTVAEVSVLVNGAPVAGPGDGVWSAGDSVYFDPAAPGTYQVRVVARGQVLLETAVIVPQ